MFSSLKGRENDEQEAILRSARRMMLLAEKDFTSKRDFDLYNKWNETGIIRDFTEDEIRAWDAERKNKHRAKKSTEFVSDLEP